jgi:hypothetical protein
MNLIVGQYQVKRDQLFVSENLKYQPAKTNWKTRLWKNPVCQLCLNLLHLSDHYLQQQYLGENLTQWQDIMATVIFGQLSGFLVKITEIGCVGT